MKARTAVGASVAGVLGLGLVLAGCSGPEPTLLRASDLDGVSGATHDSEEATTRGFGWCSPLDPYAYYRPAPTSRLQLDGGGTVGATIVDQSREGYGADHLMGLFEEKAVLCVDGLGAAGGDTIEPLTGLGADTIGWRTETGDGYQGEIAFVRLDDNRVLAVGVETDGAELPVELDDLIRLALEGVDRVGLDD